MTHSLCVNNVLSAADDLCGVQRNASFRQLGLASGCKPMPDEDGGTCLGTVEDKMMGSPSPLRINPWLSEVSETSPRS